jgi:hypothetical protein
VAEGVRQSNGDVRVGVWVRYRARKGPLTTEYVEGVGRVWAIWWYDGAFVEIDSPTHGKVSVHCNAAYSDKDGIRVKDGWMPTWPEESINVIDEPILLREGVGL